ncbi:MAG: ABC transporter substrate-binding protein, partial [Lachnospiraceae bacterium]|nr:ABC transporter substrate-binding protein [Lachnospiraceae bacterium]
MKNKVFRRVITMALAMSMVLSMSACGGGKSSVELNTGELQEVDLEELQFPLAEKTTLTGMISYPANTESNPNNRTIFKRLQEKT